MPVSEAGRILPAGFSDDASPYTPRQAVSPAEEADVRAEAINVGVDMIAPHLLKAAQDPSGSGNEVAAASWRQVEDQPIRIEDDQELILLRRGETMQAISWDMLTAMGSPSPPTDVDSTAPASPNGLSAFVARVLDQLTLSAWLPGAVLAASVALLLQFRSTRSTSLGAALAAVTVSPLRILVIIIPLLVIATIVTQAFSFEAIRTLEGYWRRRGLASFVRTLMIRIHVYKKGCTVRRLHKAYDKALKAAQTQILEGGTAPIVFKALRSDLLDKEPVSLSPKKRKQLDELNWRASCKAWHLARIDRLLEAVEAYPDDSRILPTKLGNLMRATEDRLQSVDGDNLSDFVFQRYTLAPRPVQLQHDQYRNRMEMYCVLVFVSAAPLVLTPLILHRPGISLVAVGAISGSFAALGVASYLAAIASARGYCAALRQIDKISSIPEDS